MFDAQIAKYDDLPNDVAGLSEFSYHQKNADLAGFIGLNDKSEEIFNFGKYKGKTVKSVFQKDLGYYSWLQNADFPLYTKKIWTKIQLQSKF